MADAPVPTTEWPDYTSTPTGGDGFTQDLIGLDAGAHMSLLVSHIHSFFAASFVPALDGHFNQYYKYFRNVDYSSAQIRSRGSRSRSGSGPREEMTAGVQAAPVKMNQGAGRSAA